jgi:hypothetical protein
MNSFILLLSCGAKLLHRDFHLALVRNMLEHAARDPPRPQRPMDRHPALSATISRLDEANRHHWPTSSAQRMLCRVCSAHGNEV